MAIIHNLANCALRGVGICPSWFQKLEREKTKQNKKRLYHCTSPFCHGQLQSLKDNAYRAQFFNVWNRFFMELVIQLKGSFGVLSQDFETHVM